MFVIGYPKEASHLAKLIERGDIEIIPKLDSAARLANGLLRDKAKRVLSLPNRNGDWDLVRLPDYVRNAILRRDSSGAYCSRIYKTNSPYIYKIYGTNPNRKDYGLVHDFTKLQKWIKLKWSYTTCELKDIHREPKNYWITFELSDPLALGFEKSGLII